jgi:hypothetical protein
LSQQTAPGLTLFIWTDIAPEEEDAFNDWYEHEHMPDRVLKIPGFLSGRRFVATSGAPKYLALYEMTSPDVLWSEPYVAMRREPDPRSKHFVARFQNAIRSSALLVRESGSGEGAFIGVLAIKPGPEGESAPSLDASAGNDLMRRRVFQTDPATIEKNRGAMSGSTRIGLRRAERVPAWLLTMEDETELAVSKALQTARANLADSQIESTAVMRLISSLRP